MRLIGLIGGMSPESTAHYYTAINRAVNVRLGGHHSARVAILSIDFGELVAMQEGARWDEAGALLADAARRLEAAGAELLAISANTMHRCFDAVQAAVGVPLLHIGDPLGSAARALGARRLALLGTRYTMEQPFLADWLRSHHGLEVAVPDSAARTEIHRIIYDELVHGRVDAASRGTLQAIVADLAAHGCDALVLGCTELGMILCRHDVPLPLLDTTALHAQALADRALDPRPT